ncbi:hypothetical protein OIO90_003270 [Microbotryomycetes sp. JL221]|nr:hypothetical protein OIO90_003270 [Microbotryomycetes sp. JL221]
MFRRAFTTTCSTSTQAATTTSSAAASANVAAGRRLPRTKDPLTSSSRAQHFTLSDTGNRFIVRPPSSSLPPAYPVPSTSTSTPTSTATPFSNAFVNRASATSTRHAQLLDKINQQKSSDSDSHMFEHLLPSTRKQSVEPKRLTPDQVQELQHLRRTDPSKWTRSKLATRFGISTNAVGTIGFGKGTEAKLAMQERQRQVELLNEQRQSKWGWKKQIAREERRKRRADW